MNVPRASINVTPLIDVLLVLLIIFMVAAPLRPAKLDVQVPQRPADAVELVSDELLVVTLEPDGQIALNSRPMTLEALGAELAALLELRAQRAVIVKASTDLAYGEIVPVLDTLAGAGASPVGLQVDAL